MSFPRNPFPSNRLKFVSINLVKYNLKNLTKTESLIFEDVNNSA